MRALSPISSISQPTQTAPSLEPTNSGDRGTVGGDVVSAITDAEHEREESLFSHLNDYIKTLASDVGILGNFLSEKVLEPSRGISESFSIHDDEVDGMLQVLDSELHSASTTPHGSNHHIPRTFTL